jgi:hypothetical protein
MIIVITELPEKCNDHGNYMITGWNRHSRESPDCNDNRNYIITQKV